MTDDEEERAAIREHDGRLDRRQAEAMARHAAVDQEWHTKMLFLQRLLGVSAIDRGAVVPWQASGP